MRAKTGSAGIRKFTALLIMSASSATMFGQQQPVVNRPSTSSVQVTPRQAPSPYGNAPNPAVRLQRAEGTITGYVYWQMNVLQPSSSCQGLTLKVITVNKVGMPLQLLSTTNTLTATGPVIDNSASGTPKYMLCSYAFQSMPENVALRVLLYGAPSSASVSLPPSFQIPGGNCNSTPSGTLSFILTGGEMICGNGAFNINFKLTSVPPRPTAPSQITAPLLNPPVGPKGMLSSAPQPGLLSSASAQAQQQQQTSGTLMGNMQLTPAQSGGKDQESGSSGRATQNTGGATLVPARPAAASAAAGGVPTSTTLRPSAITALEGCEKMCTARCDQRAGVNKAQCHKTCHDRCSVSRATVVLLPLPKSHGRVTNPRAMRQDEEIIAVLSQQKQAADEEFAEIRTGPQTVPSSVIATSLPASANLQGARSVQPLGPGTAQDVQGGSSSKFTHAPFLNTIVLTCANDRTPRIIRVSGGNSHSVFTPEPKYNPYTIVGCGFGPAKSGNSAYISGPSGFKANLNIDLWSDNAITAHLDPWLAGVLDQDNVTLVVSPAMVRSIQQPGFKFYAARGMPRVPDKTPQEVPLTWLPQSAVKLSSITDIQTGWDGLPSNATAAFASFSFQGSPVAGWVFRYAYGHDDSGTFFEDVPATYDCWINGDVAHQAYMVVGNQILVDERDCSYYFSFLNGKEYNWGAPPADQWDLPLRPYFAISSYDLYYDPTDASQLCGAWDDSSKTSGHDGTWDFNLTGLNQISVSWPLYWCFDQEAWPFNRVNVQRQSAYGLAVSVWGPRCIDPFTGQPDQPCMNKVKTIYGG